MHPLVQELASLFTGYAKAYGLYSRELAEQPGGKRKGKAYSIKGPVTIELWEKHVTGEQSLGIIPINEESKVRFGAIDIDKYPMEWPELHKKISKLKLPLVICRTKSGGAHLYLFVKEWTDAALVVNKLREFAALLGYGGSEIFPKQTKILPDRGDIGQWINMPYFDAADSDRYTMDAMDNKFSLEEFIGIAHQNMIEPGELARFNTNGADLLKGGPPCLNHLVSMGFPEGTRNNGLFNLGIYAQKAHPDDWEKFLEEYNAKYMTPPLEATEMLGVMKSLRKKQFNYMCKQPPIAQFCHMSKCRSCQHGVGTGAAGLPTFGTLTKLLVQPPIWFLEVEGGGRMELSTFDLQSQQAFQNKCMDALNIMPKTIKKGDWEEIVRDLLETVTVIEMPEESTPMGMLMQHLEDFCTTRAQAKNPEEILLGLPWTNNREHYFRLNDFLDYLERRKFKAVPLNRIAMHLRDLHARKVFKNLRGKGANLYVLPEFDNYQFKKFEIEKTSSDTPY